MPVDFLKSATNSFTKSSTTSRGFAPGKPSQFGIALAYYPIAGFGTFTSANISSPFDIQSGFSAGAFPFSAISFPQLYSTLTQVMTLTGNNGSYGGTAVLQNNSWFTSPHADLTTIAAPSLSGFLVASPLSAQFVGGTTSFTATTITWTSNEWRIIEGTNVIDIAGGSLVFTLSNPLNYPAIAAACLNTLAQVPIPSGPYGINIGFQGAGQIDFVFNSAFASDENYILAAAYGVPMVYYQTGGTPYNLLPWGYTIADVPLNGTNGPGLIANPCTMCCAKSKWLLNGKPGGNPWAGGSSLLGTNNHLTLYSHGWDSGFNSQTPTLAPNFPNPIPIPTTKTFDPSVTQYSTFPFYELGFRTPAT